MMEMVTEAAVGRESPVSCGAKQQEVQGEEFSDILVSLTSSKNNPELPEENLEANLEVGSGKLEVGPGEVTIDRPQPRYTLPVQPSVTDAELGELKVRPEGPTIAQPYLGYTLPVQPPVTEAALTPLEPGGGELGVVPTVLDVGSGKLEAQLEVGSGKLEAQLEVGSGKLEACPERPQGVERVGRGGTMTEQPQPRDTLPVQPSVTDAALTPLEPAGGELGVVPTVLEVGSGKLEAQLEVGSGKLEACPERPQGVERVGRGGTMTEQPQPRDALPVQPSVTDAALTPLEPGGGELGVVPTVLDVGSGKLEACPIRLSLRASSERPQGVERVGPGEVTIDQPPVLEVRSGRLEVGRGDLVTGGLETPLEPGGGKLGVVPRGATIEQPYPGHTLPVQPPVLEVGSEALAPSPLMGEGWGGGAKLGSKQEPGQDSLFFRGEVTVQNFGDVVPQEVTSFQRVAARVMTPILTEIQMHQTFKEGDGEIRVRLQPESLGEVIIRLSRQDGQLTGRILVETPLVREVLEANFTQLRQRLAEMDINLTEFSVDLHDEFSDRGQSRQRKAGQAYNYFRGMKTEVMVSLPGVDEGMTLSSRLDIMV